MTYDHKQTGKLHLILLASVVILMAWLGPAFHATSSVWLIILVLFVPFIVFLALSFQRLLIRDEGDHLTLHYGPVPLFWKRFPYSQMTAVEPSRSNILDGWGIHWVPGRGWTYNLWGFDCVKVQMGKKTVKIGTDDVDGLVAFLRGKIGEKP